MPREKYERAIDGAYPSLNLCLDTKNIYGLRNRGMAIGIVQRQEGCEAFRVR